MKELSLMLNVLYLNAFDLISFYILINIIIKMLQLPDCIIQLIAEFVLSSSHAKTKLLLQFS